MCRIFTLLLYDYRQWRTDCEYYNAQPIVELRPRFIVSATCLDVIAGDSASIVNTTAFNLRLNRIYVLQCVQHILYIITGAELPVANIASFSPRLNRAPIL